MTSEITSVDMGDTLPDKTAVAIIGAGVAGSCCAARLLQHGIEPLVLERSVFPRFTIGESLLPHALTGLRQAGLLEDIESTAPLRKPGAVFCDGTRRPRIDFADATTTEFDYAYQVLRAPFDHTLIEGARRRGTTVCYGASLEELNRKQEDAWELTVVRDGQTHSVHADFVVDASGGARVVPTLLGEKVVRAKGTRSSVFAHLKDTARPEGFNSGAIWILSPQSDPWGWIIPFSNGTASVGFVGAGVFEEGEPARESFDKVLGDFTSATQRFASSSFVMEPRGIPAYTLEPNRLHGPGYCLIGNSIGFLDPIFSSGTTIATESAVRAADAIARSFETGAVDWNSEYVAPIRKGIAVFADCVEAWYDGSLRDLIYSEGGPARTRQQIVSILAGDAWDESNPLTTHTIRKLHTLRRAVSN